MFGFEAEALELRVVRVDLGGEGLHFEDLVEFGARGEQFLPQVVGFGWGVGVGPVLGVSGVGPGCVRGTSVALQPSEVH